MKALFLLVVVAASPALAVASGFFYSDPRLDVNPISATSFEVIEARGAGARDIWCAAAQYAVTDLGLDRGRLWIEQPRGPARTAQGAKGVTFTTQEMPATSTSYSVTVRTAGANLPVIHALQFCRDYLYDIDDV